MAKNPNGFNFRGRDFKVVKFDKIFVDPDLQRRFVKSHAVTLRDIFDIRWVGILTLVMYKGRLICTDGQHRLWVLKALGYTEWVCEIHYGMTQAEISDFVSQAHGSRGKLKLSIQQEFRLGLHGSAKNEAKVIWGVVVEEHRFSIPLYDGEPVYPNGIKALGALRGIYRKHGRDVLDWTLRIVRRSMMLNTLTGQPQCEAVSSRFLLALAQFVASGEFTLRTIIQRFRLLKLEACQVRAEAAARNLTMNLSTDGFPLITSITRVLYDVMTTENWRTASVSTYEEK